MGLIVRVFVQYKDLMFFLKEIKLFLYIVVMDGINVYLEVLLKNVFLVMGNEVNGVLEEIFQFLKYRIIILNFSKNSVIESLNVVIVIGIFLSEFRRIIEK